MTNSWFLTTVLPQLKYVLSKLWGLWPTNEHCSVCSIRDALEIFKVTVCLSISLTSSFGLYLRPSLHSESGEIPDCINTSVTVTEIPQTQALPGGIPGQKDYWNEEREEEERANILMNQALFLIKEKKTRAKHWLQFEIQLVFVTEAIEVCPYKLTYFLPSLLLHTFKKTSLIFSSFYLLSHLLWKATILWTEAWFGRTYLSGRQRVKGRKQQGMLGLFDISIFPTSTFITSYVGMQGHLSNLILPTRKSQSRRLRLQLLGPFSGVCWSQLAVACRSRLCSSLLSSVFSDVMLVAWNWPWWGIYAIEICKCYLPIRDFFSPWRTSLPAYHCPLSLTYT